MKINPDKDFISKNYEKTLELIDKFYAQGDSELYRSIKLFMTDFGERYILCPASTKKEFFSSFPGGLAYHNLCVFFWMKKFAELMHPDKFEEQSLFKVSLLHAIGKLGDETGEFYHSATDWHYSKDIYYLVNTKLRQMKTAHRSLYLAQKYNINLTHEEYAAILLQDGEYDEGNGFYKYKEPHLAIVLQFALQWSIKREKDNVVLWPPRKSY